MAAYLDRVALPNLLCLSGLPLRERRKVSLKGWGKRQIHCRRVVAAALPL